MRRLLTIPLLLSLATAQQKPFVPMPGHRSHPTRTKVLIVTGGVITGAVIALLQRHTCPKRINGYSYDGTPPCPSKNYDPSPKGERVK